MTDPIWDTILPKQRLCLSALGLDDENPPPGGVPVNEILWGGSGSGGKSELLRMVAAECARQWPTSKGAIFRRGYTQVYDTHIKWFLEHLPPEIGRCHTAQNHITFHWWNGSQTEFFHCQNPEDYYHYGSYEWAYVLLDESTQFLPVQLTYLMARLRSTIKGWWPITVLCTNPPGESQEWHIEEFVNGHEEGDPGYMQPWLVPPRPETNYRPKRLYIPSSLKDNTLVPYDIAMAQMQGIEDPVLREAIAMGNWHITSESFFRFRKEAHVVDGFPDGGTLPPPEWITWRAQDWGFSAPFGCLWLARDPNAKILKTYVYRELNRRGLSAREQAKEVIELSRDDHSHRFTLCDPDNIRRNRAGIVGPHIGTEWQKAGLGTLVAANNRRVLGWARVHRALADVEGQGPELQVLRSCPETIKQLTRAKRNPHKPEDLLEPNNPTGDRDEMLDCLDGNTKIAVYPRGDWPIQFVYEGDQVITRAGPRMVKDCWEVGIRQCLTLHLSDGTSITATPNHRFWVAGKEEWLPLESLSPGDILLAPDKTISVVSTEDAGIRSVWDIQVNDPDYPEFVAGGVLVHNCLRYGLLGAATASRKRPPTQKVRYHAG